MNITTMTTQVLFRSTESVRIHLIKDQLEAAGISSVIHNNFRAYNIGYIELLVQESDFAKGIDVIRSIYPKYSLQTIQCPECGSLEVRISSNHKNKMLRKLTIWYKQLYYMVKHQLPDGYYDCRVCHHHFYHKDKK